MAEPVQIEQLGPVGEIVFGRSVSALGDAVRQVTARDGIEVLILRAQGRVFSPGLDVDETGRLDPILADLEAWDRPVVAAIEGAALGAGLALALACDYRVAGKGARFGLPEISLGLVPGAGATQRLSRVVGAEGALDLMLSGRRIGAEAAMALGLIDDVIPDALPRGARVFARGLLAEGLGCRRVSERRDQLAAPSAYAAAIAEARAEASPIPAAARITDCVEAAQLLPFEAGLAFERAALEECAATPEAEALRYLQRAERSCQPEAGAPVQAVGLWGAGLAPVAAMCLEAGLPVLWAGTHGVEAVHGQLDRAVTRGRLSPDAAALRRDLLVPVETPEALASVEITLQTEGDPAASETVAYLGPVPDLEARAAAHGRPLAAIQFYAPEPVVRVAEIAATDPTHRARLHALVGRLGKLAIDTQPGHESLGHGVWGAALSAADLLVGQGHSPSRVDQILRAEGFRFGLFEFADLGGLDQPWLARLGGFGARLRAALIAAARGGLAQGAGYLDHSRSDGADPGLAPLLAQLPKPEGRPLPEAEIAETLLAVMAQAGQHFVETGQAKEPAHIDLIMTHAFGFPRWKGGPMIAARQAAERRSEAL